MAIFNYDKRTTHVGFADEAYWNGAQEFRSVACISTRTEDYLDVERRLCDARCKAGARLSEIKWSEVRTADCLYDATSAIRVLVELAVEKKLRIDVVVWNKHDRAFLEQRYNIRSKRDEWHLRNMYRWLVSSVIARWRAIGGSHSPFWTFAIHHQGIDFDVLERHIQTYALRQARDTHVDIRKGKSMLNYSIQLADLLAGMGAYSHLYWTDLATWWPQQQSLSEFRLPSVPQAQYRFPLLNRFYQQCQGNSLGVSLFRPKPGFNGRGFWTQNHRDPQHTINFWPYTIRRQLS